MKDPSSVVAVGQIVTVWVYQIDQSRGSKVGLSMVEPKALPETDDKQNDELPGLRPMGLANRLWQTF